jgi:hypothetical protein
MSDKKISQLTAATTPLAGSEVLPIVQGGATVKVSVDNLTAGKPVSMTNLTYTGTLTGSTGIANIGSGQIYKAADGKVGFGTTSPSHKITLVGSDFTTAPFNGQSYGDGAAERLRVGYKNGSPDTGLVPAQIITDVTLLQIASRDTTNGAIAFFTGTGLPETFRIGNTGNVTVNTGNLVIGTAGKGIDFSADANAAGMTSELLDDYEEGTFTPQFRDGATGNIATADTSTGRYTKIGNRVDFTIDLVNINTTGLTAGNGIFITGLPFAAVSGANIYYAGSMFSSNVTATTGATAPIVIQGTSLLQIVNKTTTAFTAMVVSAVTSGTGDLYINGTYQTA